MRARRAAMMLSVVAAAFTLPVPTAESAAPLCFGRTPTIVGTDGDDELYAEPGVVNVIYAGRGNDTVWGGWSGPGGYYCGGPGNDRVSGGSGDDHVSGGQGPDAVNGGGESSGEDIVMGGAQDDFVEDTDDCEFDTDPGTDILIAGPGDDYMCSWQGEDVMHGQAGNDDLYDYSHGRTRLLGGPDNDTLQAEWDPYGGWATDLPDFVSGDGGIDSAVVDRNDKVTASTEHVSSRS